MTERPRRMATSVHSSTLADILERVLDKGVVVAGDIKIKLVDIELLTIQIRLVICSVDRAIDMGMNWWTLDPNLSPLARDRLSDAPPAETKALQDRITQLEDQIQRLTGEKSPNNG